MINQFCFIFILKSFLNWKKEIVNLDEYRDKYLYVSYLWIVFREVYGKKLNVLPKEIQENIIEGILSFFIIFIKEFIIFRSANNRTY